ncbi:MAG: efflux RND transporter permease subunit [Verrucomicrobiota bacterium]
MSRPKSRSQTASYLYENRYLLVLLVVITLVAGISALSNLPRLEDPRIAQRNATIVTLFPGASAQRVEALVSKPIEDELRELSEIKIIESSSRDGVSAVSVELQDWVTEKTNQTIFSKIRDRLAEVEPNLPAGAFAPDFDDQRGAIAFGFIAALSIPNSSDEQIGIQNRLAEELADRLRNMAGTELVRLYGDAEEEILITVEEPKLAALGLDAQLLSQMITEADSKNTAGALQSLDQRILIEVKGELETLQRIARIPVGISGSGAFLYLGDIAHIEKSIQGPPSEVAFTDADNRSILVAARMTPSMRIEQWTATAQTVVTDFEAEFGTALNIETVFNQSVYTDERLGQLSTNLILGICIVMIVVMLSMGWKSSLIVGISLPLAMSGTLFSLTFFGEQIHQMTIFGMIIAIGLLIDNAIVVTDEIRKNVNEREMDRLEALVNAVNHLRVPLLASTLTTILGFMPIFLLPGNVGDFISPIAISVVMALAFSFVLSISIIATIAAIFSKKSKPGKRRWWNEGLRFPALSDVYHKFLTHSLSMPKRVLIATSLLPIAGFILSSNLPNVFFPSADRDHFEINIWLPDDASIHRTEALAREVDKVLNEQAEISKTHWMVGGSTPSVYYNQIMTRDNARTYAHGVVFARSVDQATGLISRTQSMLNERFPEARIVVRPFSQGPPVSSPVAFRIVGQDAAVLRILGEQLRLALEQHPKVTHSYASVVGGTPKLRFDANEEKARIAGFSLNQIATQFRSKLDGDIGGTVLEDLEELPVRLRVSDEARENPNNIASIQFHSPDQDRWVPATALGNFALIPEFAGITRRNGERFNQIDAFLVPEAAPVSVASAVLATLEENGFSLPAGYRLEAGGDADEQSEAVGLLTTYLPVLLILMAATLILSFKSVSLAVLFGVVAILSAGLGFLSLSISGYPIGFNPLVGSAGLIGVAINGSIVVIASIRANTRASEGHLDAIVTETIGCSRHIISTTSTTVTGFIPLLIAGGTFWPPLAVVIAGGVGFSVILSLGFTPAAYIFLRQINAVKGVSA